MSRPANKASIAPNSTPGWPSRSEIPALTLSQSTPFALYAPSGAPRGQGATPFGAPEGVRAAHTQGAPEGVSAGARKRVEAERSGGGAVELSGGSMTGTAGQMLVFSQLKQVLGLPVSFSGYGGVGISGATGPMDGL